MRRSHFGGFAVLAALTLLAANAYAFCGFYVAQGGADLFNRASKVVYLRDGERSVITMASDYQGEPSAFAMVVPVPEVLPRDAIKVVDPNTVAHLDAFTAPRLVEYHDPNPCQTVRGPCRPGFPCPMMRNFTVAESAAVEDKSTGVTVEASYAVGEYDILILSAEESGGLQRWLTDNGYRVPEAAKDVLADYLAAGMKFFVAKVDIGRQQFTGFAELRPLQIQFHSKDFGLPIRLGMVNANGPQDLFLYTLTRRGRVLVANYPTLPIPTDTELPVFVRPSFDKVYPAAFEVKASEAPRAAFLEYAWDMASCDPCAAPPLSSAALAELGVDWQTGDRRQSVFVTRLHMRYQASTHSQDLQLQVTDDRGFYQGRYVLRHPWAGEMACDAADDYRKRLAAREKDEDRNLAELVGVTLETAQRWRRLRKVDLQ